MGPSLPLGDHLNAGWVGERWKPCRIWANGGLATIRSKSVWKKCQVRIASKQATCGYFDSIPFAHILRMKKPLTFPTDGRSGDEAVHFSSEWALRGMELLIFSQRMCTWWTRGGSMAPRAGGPSRNVADVPRGRAGGLVRARTDAGESTRCCDKTFRINDTEQYRAR